MNYVKSLVWAGQPAKTNTPNPSVNEGSLDERSVSQVERTLGQKIILNVRRVQAAAEIAQKTATVGYNLGPRMVTAGVAVAAGAQSAWDGDYYQGAAMAGMGVVEIKRIYNEIRKNPDDLQNLLKDVDASLNMIEGLGHANEESFAVIKGHLGTVGQGMKELKSLKAKVSEILTDTDTSVETYKARALKMIDKSEKSFLEAQEFYGDAQGLLEEARKDFEIVSDLLPKAIEVAQGKQNEASADRFAKYAVTALQACEAGQEKLTQASALIGKGNKKLKTSQSCNRQVADKLLGITGKVSEAVVELKANNDARAQELEAMSLELKKAQEAVEVANKRNSQMLELAELARKDVKKAEGLAGNTISKLKVFIGAGLGALIGAWIAGPIVAAILAVVLVMALQNSDKIIDGLASIIAPRNKSDKSLVGYESENMTFRFNDVSSSSIDKLRGKASSTEGKLEVKIGNGIVLKVNLEEDYAISKAELMRLQEEIVRNLTDKTLTREQAIKVLKDIEKLKIGERVGLVPADNPFFSKAKEVIGTFA